MDIDKLSAGVAAVEKAGKVYFAGEYGWTPQSQTKTKIDDFFKWIEDRNGVNNTKPVIVGGELSVAGYATARSRPNSEHSEYTAKTKRLLTFYADHFWSLFGRNVPDCSKFVDHNVSSPFSYYFLVRVLIGAMQDGFTLHYNDPRNSANTTDQIKKIRRHLFKMQGAEVTGDLPAVPCPGTPGRDLHS